MAGKIPSDIIRRVRRLQIRARRAVANLLGGEYHSVYKGAGLAFDDVRAYEPGDDVRAIDWNITARLGQPFIKRFVEERELTVWLVVDASGSLACGSQRFRKHEVVAELAAMLACAAVLNHDRVGLLLFSDRIEQFLPARKGLRHFQRVLREILVVEPAGQGTNLALALDTLSRWQRKRAVVFLLSDFLATGYERALALAAQRHDLTALWVSDPWETALPASGRIEWRDAETGRSAAVDLSQPAECADYARRQQLRIERVRTQLRRLAIDCLEVATTSGHQQALISFFHRKSQRLRHS